MPDSSEVGSKIHACSPFSRREEGARRSAWQNINCHSIAHIMLVLSLLLKKKEKLQKLTIKRMTRTSSQEKWSESIGAKVVHQKPWGKWSSSWWQWRGSLSQYLFELGWHCLQALCLRDHFRRTLRPKQKDVIKQNNLSAQATTSKRNEIIVVFHSAQLLV